MTVTPLNAAAAVFLETQAAGTTPPEVVTDIANPELARLVLIKVRKGAIPADEYEAAIVATGWTKRHIQRQVAKLIKKCGPTGAVKKLRFELTDHHKQVILACNGILRVAYDQLAAADEELPSYNTFWRRFDEQPSGVRAYFRHGADGLVDFWLYPPYEAPERNSVWQADHFELPNDVIADGCTTTLVKPWLTVFVDDKSRKVMGWSLIALPGRHPGADEVNATICDAVRIRLESGVEVGGVPRIVRWDNDRSFTAGSVVQLGSAVGFECHAVPPYSGHMKGKVERFGRRVQEQFCVMQPGFTHGPKTYTGKDPFRDTPPLTATQMRAKLELWFAEYDHTVHEGHGKTPHAAWVADATPLRRATDSQLRSALLVATKTYKAHKRKGVHFDGQWWQGAGMLDIVGRPVEIHHPINDDTFVEVYYKGVWHCTAWPTRNLTESQKKAIWEGRDDMYAEVRELHDQATRMRVGADARAGTTDATPSVASMPAVDPLDADDDTLYALLGRLPDAEDASGDTAEPAGVGEARR